MRAASLWIIALGLTAACTAASRSSAPAKKTSTEMYFTVHDATGQIIGCASAFLEGDVGDRTESRVSHLPGLGEHRQFDDGRWNDEGTFRWTNTCTNWFPPEGGMVPGPSGQYAVKARCMMTPTMLDGLKTTTEYDLYVVRDEHRALCEADGGTYYTVP